MPGSPTLLLILVALVAGAWLAAAAWATRRAWRAARVAEAMAEDGERLGALLDAGPAIALIVAADGSISGSPRLAGALGLAALPPRWLALFGEGAPLAAAEAA
jgi:hypothetical protein